MRKNLMNKMKQAFTMIELIFVIVIIAILATVAIPKLTATRDDATISDIIANTRTMMSDFSTNHIALGNAKWIQATTHVSDVTNVRLDTTECGTNASDTPIAGNTFFLCDNPAGIACVTITTDSNGTSYRMKTTTETSSVVCNAIATNPTMMGYVGTPRGTDKVHQLSGTGIIP